MNTQLRTVLYRFLFMLSALSLTVFSVPAVAQAATPEAAAAKSYFIQITAVEKNKTITVSGTGFPANTSFNVRVGPFSDFNKKAVQMGSINTGETGAFTINITLPSAVKDVRLNTVRLDSALKQYSYNVFTNENLGKINQKPDAWLPSNPPTPTPTPVVTNACQIVSTTPSQSMKPKADFDAVWTLKNTGTSTWSHTEVDYRYYSGEKIYKRGSAYDLPKDVKPSETIRIVVDMVAPAKAGTYKTEWLLTGLCSLPLTVTVK